MTDPAAPCARAVAEAVAAAARGERWCPLVLRWAVGDALDTLAVTVGVRRRHTGGWLGRECDADLDARVLAERHRRAAVAAGEGRG